MKKIEGFKDGRPLSTLRIGILKELIFSSSSDVDISSLNDKIIIISINIAELIDNPDYLIEIINENIKLISFEQLILILEWLFAWYKTTEHPIICKNISYSLPYIIFITERKRERIRGD